MHGQIAVRSMMALAVARGQLSAILDLRSQARVGTFERECLDERVRLAIRHVQDCATRYASACKHAPVGLIPVLGASAAVGADGLTLPERASLGVQ